MPIVQFAPAATLLPQLFDDILKSALLMLIFEMVRVAPLLLRVML